MPTSADPVGDGAGASEAQGAASPVEPPGGVTAAAGQAASPGRRWLGRLLLAAGVVAIALLVARFPLADIGAACRALGPAVLVTPVIALGWFAANTTALFHILERRVPWPTLFWNRLVGEGFNSIIPAGGIGGEPFKVRHLARRVPASRAVVAVLADRFIENIAGLVAAAAFLASSALSLELDLARGTRAALLGGAGAATAVAAVATALVLSRVPGRFGARLARWMGSPALVHERVRPSTFARAALWCLVGRALGLAEIALLYHLLGIPVGPGLVVFTAGAATLAGFIGFAVPQGMGVTEAATVGAFALLHLPGPAGVAFALARRGRMLFMSIVGMALYLAARPGQRRGAGGAGQAGRHEAS